MMTGPPLVSVCMPVYNAERFVAESIRSILGQTFRDFEFLILDDGSTDGSLEVLRRYAKRDPRIRLTSRPNKGLVPSLNELVDQARGEFLARMDADDISIAERFAKQVEYLRIHSDCAVVGCRVWEVDAEGLPYTEYPTLEHHEEIDAFHFRLEGPALLHPTVMMRREAVLAVGGYRQFAVSEEIDLFLRLAESWRLGRVPEFLLKYRVHGENYSRAPKTRAISYQANCDILIDAFRRRSLAVVLPPPPPLPPETGERTPKGPWDPERNWAFGWRALSARYPRSARRYAIRLLARKPLSLDSWRLMYCALRGH